MKAVCKVLQQGSSAPFRMNHDFLLGWQFSDIFIILIRHFENNLKCPQALPWSLTDLKGLTWTKIWYEEADTLMVFHAWHAPGNHVLDAPRWHWRLCPAAWPYITKPWLWKVLPEKKKRHENQKNKNIYATRPSNFHPLLHNGPYRCKLVAITGSDNITAFFGKDKWKAVKIPQHNEGYVRAMMSIGEEWWVSEETFKIKGTETLVWQLHWSVKCPPYNTIQYNTIQYNTIQYNTMFFILRG